MTVPRRTRGKAAKSLKLIESSIEILAEIQPAGVRAVCYQLFNKKLILDMGKSCTSRVGKQLVYARETGSIPSKAWRRAWRGLPAPCSGSEVSEARRTPAWRRRIRAPAPTRHQDSAPERRSARGVHGKLPGVAVDPDHSSQASAAPASPLGSALQRHAPARSSVRRTAESSCPSPSCAGTCRVADQRAACRSPPRSFQAPC
jgi:hypothetical protein